MSKQRKSPLTQRLSTKAAVAVRGRRAQPVLRRDTLSPEAFVEFINIANRTKSADESAQKKGVVLKSAAAGAVTQRSNGTRGTY
jgi:hypothetical protein